MPIFTSQFRDESLNVQDRYFQLDAINDEGLFSRVLIPELHYFGETVGERTPSEAITSEAQGLINWLHTLAIRNPGEETPLAYSGKFCDVGVILMAAPETFDQYGYAPYIRRAASMPVMRQRAIFVIQRLNQKSCC